MLYSFRNTDTSQNHCGTTQRHKKFCEALFPAFSPSSYTHVLWVYLSCSVTFPPELAVAVVGSSHVTGLGAEVSGDVRDAQ